jgi:hypothetical protein
MRSRSDNLGSLAPQGVSSFWKDQYLRALEKLEELHLVIVDRDAEDYREWVMREPEDEISVRSPGRIRSIPSPLWRSGQQQRCTA